MLEDLVRRYPELEVIIPDIQKTYAFLISCLRDGGTLFLCGNGGSASDSEHIVGELLKGFLNPRCLLETEQQCINNSLAPADAEYLVRKLQRGLRAVALNGHPALSSAVSNDTGADMVFAQQLYVLGKENDVLIGISTSGNSLNVLRAAQVARVKKMKIIALTGRNGGRLTELADAAIVVPAEETYRIQEYHLPVYHALCAMLEKYFFDVESVS